MAKEDDSEALGVCCIEGVVLWRVPFDYDELPSSNQFEIVLPQVQHGFFTRWLVGPNYIQFPYQELFTRRDWQSKLKVAQVDAPRLKAALRQLNRSLRLSYLWSRCLLFLTHALVFLFLALWIFMWLDSGVHWLKTTTSTHDLHFLNVTIVKWGAFSLSVIFAVISYFLRLAIQRRVLHHASSLLEKLRFPRKRRKSRTTREREARAERLERERRASQREVSPRTTERGVVSSRGRGGREAAAADKWDQFTQDNPAQLLEEDDNRPNKVKLDKLPYSVDILEDEEPVFVELGRTLQDTNAATDLPVVHYILFSLPACMFDVETRARSDSGTLSKPPGRVPVPSPSTTGANNMTSNSSAAESHRSPLSNRGEIQVLNDDSPIQPLSSQNFPAPPRDDQSALAPFPYIRAPSGTNGLVPPFPLGESETILPLPGALPGLVRIPGANLNLSQQPAPPPPIAHPNPPPSASGPGGPRASPMSPAGPDTPPMTPPDFPPPGPPEQNGAPGPSRQHSDSSLVDEVMAVRNSEEDPTQDEHFPPPPDFGPPEPSAEPPPPTPPQAANSTPVGKGGFQLSHDTVLLESEDSEASGILFQLSPMPADGRGSRALTQPWVAAKSKGNARRSSMPQVREADVPTTAPSHSSQPLGQQKAPSHSSQPVGKQEKAPSHSSQPLGQQEKEPEKEKGTEKQGKIAEAGDKRVHRIRPYSPERQAMLRTVRPSTPPPVGPEPQAPPAQANQASQQPGQTNKRQARFFAASSQPPAVPEELQGLLLSSSSSSSSSSSTSSSSPSSSSSSSSSSFPSSSSPPLPSSSPPLLPPPSPYTNTTQIHISPQKANPRLGEKAPNRQGKPLETASSIAIKNIMRSDEQPTLSEQELQARHLQTQLEAEAAQVAFLKKRLEVSELALEMERRKSQPSRTTL